MIVIAVVNTKGGVGKTTITAMLAVRAAQESPRVALVDLDPQASLTAWWGRRGEPHNPEIMRGVETASDAIDSLQQVGYDWVFIDTPPAFLQLIEDTIQTADLVVIPMKASALDAAASEDAVVITREASREYMVILNDVDTRWKSTQNMRDFLEESGIPVAETMIGHRASHVAGMTIGKSASEVNKGKDKAAVDEIDALWLEVKAAAKKGVKAKAKIAAKAGAQHV